MADLTLRQFVEFASDKAEKLFRAFGYLAPIWHYVDRDGNHHIAPAPATDKDTGAAIMRAMLELCGATRCMFMDEAWTVDAIDRGEDYNKRLMAWIKERGNLVDHPDRIECVMFMAEDVSEGIVTGRRVIIRGQGKPKLGPLEFDDRTGWTSEGRFVGMLPKRAGAKVQ